MSRIKINYYFLQMLFFKIQYQIHNLKKGHGYECHKITLNNIRVIFKKQIKEKQHLSYDVASGCEITPCNKIDKPLVVYRFTGNVMKSITTLRT